MGMEIVGYVIMAAGAINSAMEQQEAKKNAANSADEQRKARQEQKASQAQQAAEEKRKMVREERVRRAKILQASENTGVADSSGEAGALGSLATQFSSNTGSNNSSARQGQMIGNYNQAAADFSSAAQGNMQQAAQWQQLSSIGGDIAKNGNIFSTAMSTSSKQSSDPFSDFYLKGNRGTGD